MAIPDFQLLTHPGVLILVARGQGAESRLTYRPRPLGNWRGVAWRLIRSFLLIVDALICIGTLALVTGGLASKWQRSGLLSDMGSPWPDEAGWWLQVMWRTGWRFQLKYFVFQCLTIVEAMVSICTLTTVSSDLAAWWFFSNRLAVEME